MRIYMAYTLPLRIASSRASLYLANMLRDMNAKWFFFTVNERKTLVSKKSQCEALPGFEPGLAESPTKSQNPL